MSTVESDGHATTPTGCVCGGPPRWDVSLRQKNTRPTARAGRVASDLSLAWLLIMITEDPEDVNE